MLLQRFFSCSNKALLDEMHQLWNRIDPQNLGVMTERTFTNLMQKRIKSLKTIKKMYKQLEEVSKEVSAAKGISLDLLAQQMIQYVIERNSASRDKAFHYAVQVICFVSSPKIILFLSHIVKENKYMTDVLFVIFSGTFKTLEVCGR